MGRYPLLAMASETLEVRPTQGQADEAIACVDEIQVCLDRAEYQSDRGAYVCWLGNRSVAEIPADKVPAGFGNAVRRAAEYGETWEREEIEKL